MERPAQSDTDAETGTGVRPGSSTGFVTTLTNSSPGCGRFAPSPGKYLTGVTVDPALCQVPGTAGEGDRAPPLRRFPEEEGHAPGDTEDKGMGHQKELSKQRRESSSPGVPESMRN